MPIKWDIREHLALGAYVARWLAITAAVAVLVGSAVALFLWSLKWATDTRVANGWLIYLMPLAGVAIAWTYHLWGKEAERGNNLIMEQIHEPGGGVPLAMAPLVLIGTVATHLFGGSAGREGTAVQMGGSLAHALARPLKLSPDDTRTLLSCGIAAGFGAVFGTPLTGAIFALEVVTLGRMRYDALIPCLMASVFGDMVCTWWGIGHTHYAIAAPLVELAEPFLRLDLVTAGKIALASIAFGLASVLFAELCHGFSALFKRTIPVFWMRPVIGALLVLGITWLLGTTAYLGLGVYPQDETGISIVGAFQEGGVDPFSWFWKLLLTAITLGCGFKGGEVTPLFFVGAALGYTMGTILGLPVDLMAGIGFVAVFAGATNTPLACTIMGVELFGAEYLLYFALACFLSYLFSGHSGIYLSQRLGSGKAMRRPLGSTDTLRQLRENADK